MSNNKKANKSTSKSAAIVESKPVVIELTQEEKDALAEQARLAREAKAYKKTRAGKEANRLANFLAEYGQILAEAGIDTSNKTKVQLQQELANYQASLAEQAKADAKAQVKGFDPQALAKAEADVEANPPQCAADLQHEKNLQGFAALQALLAQEQAVLWDEDLVNTGDVAAPTEEVSLPQQEATVVEETIDAKEAVTMTTSTSEILAVVPGVSSVQETINLVVQAAYKPDMGKVEEARNKVYYSSKGLLEGAIRRMRREAEAQINKDLEAQLIAQAEADAQARAIDEVMADNVDLGLTEEMLLALLEEERNMEATRLAEQEAAKAEAARVKAHARKQRELLAEVRANDMIDTAEELAEELEALTNVSNAGALDGSARKIKQLAAAGKLTEAAVHNFVGQYRKAYTTWKSLTRVAPAAPVKREQQQAAD